MSETTLTLTLTSPLKFGDEIIETINLSEPTLGQLKKAHREAYDLDKLTMLIHLNAALPMTVVDKMSRRDGEACDRFFDRFKLPPEPTPVEPAQP